MPAGRPKTPTKLRLLRGNPGRRPIDDDEPDPSPRARIPTPPQDMGKYGRSEWRRMAKVLVPLGLLTDADMSAFRAMCHSFQRMCEAEDQIRIMGMVVMTPSKYPVQSPFIAIANKARAECMALWAQFGMTPAARTKVSVQRGSDGGLGDLMYGDED